MSYDKMIRKLLKCALVCIRQLLYQRYQELQQSDCIVGSDFAIAVTVCICLLLTGAQCYNTGNCLVQHNCIGNTAE